MIPSSLYIPPHTWKIGTFPTQMMFGKMGHTQWMNYQLDGALCIVSVICSFLLSICKFKTERKTSTAKRKQKWIQGDNSTAELKEVNTQYKGRCYVWTPKFKIKNGDPSGVWFSLRAPKDKLVHRNFFNVYKNKKDLNLTAQWHFMFNRRTLFQYLRHLAHILQLCIL